MEPTIIIMLFAMETKDEYYHNSVHVLPVFVSSTFNDMHRERDCIASLIAPDLNSRLRPYGAMLRFIDLRWGIITSHSYDASTREEKILKVCFDEILRSKPLFVGLLGNRYGWVPDSQRRNNIKSSILCCFPEYDISVTEMEMRFGALRQSEVNEHAIFCFRDNGGRDERIDSRLIKLKDDIRQSIDADRCIDYHPVWDGTEVSNIGDFRQMLTEAMWREACDMLHIDEETTNNTDDAYNYLSTDFSMELYSHESVFYSRPELSDILKWIDQGKSISLTGPTGCGKSALLSKIHSELSSVKGCLPIFYDVACNAQSKSPTIMLNYLCHVLETKLDENHVYEIFQTEVENYLGIYVVVEKSLMKLEEKLCELYSRLFEKGIRLVIIIDNIDSIQTDRYQDNLLFLPKGASVLVSHSDKIHRQQVPTEKFVIDHLTTDEAYGMLERLFCYYEKRLHPSVAKAAVQKSSDGRGRCNALWLATLSHYFIHFDIDDFMAMLNMKEDDGEGRIESYCLHLVDEAPSDIILLMQFMIKRAERTFGHNTVLLGMGLLCLGRQGFRDMDFENMIGSGWDSIQFAEFCRWMRPFITESQYSRQWMIVHSYMASAWQQHIGTSECCRLHGEIAKMLFLYPSCDPLRWQEAFYHAFEGHQWRLCAHLVADLGKKSALPVQMLFRQMETKQIMDSVAKIVHDADDKMRPEVIGNLFKFALVDWTVKYPIESAKLYLQCIGEVDFSSVDNDYQFTCLCESLKDRLIQTKFRDWSLNERLALILLSLSEHRDLLTPGKGIAEKSIASMELFNSLSAQGRLDEAIKYINNN